VRCTRQAVIDFLADRLASLPVAAFAHCVEQLADDVALLHFASQEAAFDGTRRRAARQVSV
jgi:hypothetical protein